MGPDRVRTYKDEFLNIGFRSIVNKALDQPQCAICAKVLSTTSPLHQTLATKFGTESSPAPLHNRTPTTA